MPRGWVQGIAIGIWVWPMLRTRTTSGLSTGWWRGILAGLIMAIAVWHNPNVLVLIGSMLLCLSWPALRQFDWKRIGGLVLKILPGLLLAWPFFRWTSNWYARNHTFDFHQSIDWDWSLNNLQQGLGLLDKFLDVFGLINPHSPSGYLGWLAFLVLSIVAGRYSSRGTVTLIACALVVVLSLGVGKLLDGTESVFYGYNRMFLAVPVVIAMAWTSIRLSWHKAGWLLPVLACWFTLESSIILYGQVFQEFWKVVPTQIQDQSYPESVSFLRMRSAKMDSVVKAEQPSLIILPKEELPLAYAYAAWYPESVDLLAPEADRRTWILFRHRETPASACLLFLPESGRAGSYRGFGELIRPESDQPIYDYLRAEGMAVRDY